MRTTEVTGLACGSAFPNGTAVVRELTIGDMRRLRNAPGGDEERGLRMVALALVDPPMTLEELDALPASAIVDVVTLTGAVSALNVPEAPPDAPPA